MTKILNSEILKLAKEKLKKGWVQGHFGVTARGEATNSLDPSACHFCSVGAIKRAGHELTGQKTNDYSEARAFVLDAIRETDPDCTSVMHFNDRRFTQKEDVLKVFEKAIHRAEASELKGPEEISSPDF